MKHHLQPKYKGTLRNMHFLGLELKSRGIRLRPMEAAAVYNAGEKWAKNKLQQIRYETKTALDPEFVEVESALNGKPGTTIPGNTGEEP